MFHPIIFGILAMLAAQAKQPALARFTYSEPHMGTRFKVILYAEDEAKAKAQQLMNSRFGPAEATCASSAPILNPSVAGEHL